MQERCQSTDCSNPHYEPIRFNSDYLTSIASRVESAVVDGDSILSLSYWKRVRGDSIKAAVIEALQRIGRPATFGEVAEVLCSTDISKRSISKRQVQTCLGNGFYPEFRLAGPGTYGLSEWGFEKYKSSTESVLELLQTNAGPMEAAQIINRLTRDNKYSEGNIRRVLHYDRRLVRTSEGMYDLKERVESNSKATKAADIVLDIGDKREVSIVVPDPDGQFYNAGTASSGIRVGLDASEEGTS